jgi:SPP1 gp7 family putative phage head morphogenesis protein
MSEVNAPDPLKSQQKFLADGMEGMVELMSRLYKNQVLLEMNKGTLDKFADAQTGNYAAVLTKLSKSLNKKILGRFSNKRIKEMSRQALEKNDKRSRKILYDRLAKDIGIDAATLLKRDGTTYDFNALVIETTAWATKLRDETLEMYTANTLRAMTLGTPIDQILKQYDGLVEKRKNHAKFTARNQIASFNSVMNKTRAQKLGIKKAVWITSRDERVRPSHENRNKKEFDLSKGCFSSLDGKFLLPGTDYNCRCSYRMILEDDPDTQE